jgi:hypothetical protein
MKTFPGVFLTLIVVYGAAILWEWRTGKLRGQRLILLLVTFGIMVFLFVANRMFH